MMRTLRSAAVVAILTLVACTQRAGAPQPEPPPNAAPFGWELGVATLEDVAQAVEMQHLGPASGGGVHYRLRASQLNMTDLTSADAYFHADGTLVGVATTYRKRQFKALLGVLRDKYEVTHEDVPFVGNALVLFEAGNARIVLRSPHMDVRTYLQYWTRPAYASVTAAAAAEAAAEAARVRDRL